MDSAVPLNRRQADQSVVLAPTEGARLEAAVGDFEAIYREHHAATYRYAVALSGNVADAADITSETFERAFRAIASGGGPKGDVRAWLFVVARRIGTDRWRRLTRRSRNLHPPTASDDLGDANSRIWLEQLVQVLPVRQREVIALRYMKDLSDDQIGRILGLSESGVRSLVARAIATLREHPEAWM
jgi:RNA polymerase sigma factor (sigma-70 family)